MLAGMDQVAGPALAAAVAAAGGFGTVGGARYTPKMLREMLAELKQELKERGCAEDVPFGVDLLIPQVGGGARKTNVSDEVKGKKGRVLMLCSCFSMIILTVSSVNFSTLSLTVEQNCLFLQSVFLLSGRLRNYTSESIHYKPSEQDD